MAVDKGPQRLGGKTDATEGVTVIGYVFDSVDGGERLHPHQD
nr:MAG: hypothetical protein BECKDK2373C_GA0170839_104417 [Candidatus Kentron sp. DK]